MEMLFLKLLNMSINASILVAIVLVFRLVFKKAPKWISCILWALVGIRLIVPFSFESRASLIPSEEPIPTTIVHQLNPQIDTSSQVINEYVSNSLATSPYDSATKTGILFFALGCIWLIGLAIMLSYLFISYLVLRNKLRTSTMYMKGIKQSDRIDSPFVLGIFKPTIYIPYSISGADLEYVISHEKAHISRKDYLWKPLGFLVLSVYWFNPAIWIAYIILCRDIESACDEKVISVLDEDSRKGYSLALLDCSVNHKFITACPVAFGETDVKSRIRGIMNYKKPAFWIIIFAIIACIIVGICFITNPKNDKVKADETEANVTETTIAETSVTETSATETSIAETSDTNITVTEEIIDGQRVIVTEEQIGPEVTRTANILGYEDTYFDLVRSADEYPNGVYYCEMQLVRSNDQSVLGTWFGFADFVASGPDVYIVDIDGDGNNELISNCQYEEDGTRRVFIYRNNNGTIEQGVISEDYYLAALGLSDADSLPQPDAIREIYDSEYGVIRITVDDDMVFEMALKDASNIEFTEYVS